MTQSQAEGQIAGKRDSKNRTADGDELTQVRLEQWKTCVESASVVSTNRVTSNGFFVASTSALAAVSMLLPSRGTIVASVAGIVVSVFWLLSIRNYATLNRVKFNIINDLESELPDEPFTREWRALEREKGYQGISKIECSVAVVFVVMFAIIAVMACKP